MQHHNATAYNAASYNAVQRDGSGWQSGGPGAVGGHACDAIRGHRTASIWYFSTSSNFAFWHIFTYTITNNLSYY